MPTNEELQELEGLLRNGEEKLPKEAYTKANLNEAKIELEQNPNFKRFYEVLSSFDLHLIHQTYSLKKIAEEKVIKSVKLLNKNERTFNSDVKLFNNHGFVFSSLCFVKEKEKDVVLNFLKNLDLEGDYIIKKLSEEDLAKSVFNAKDCLNKKLDTNNLANYQKRMIFTDDAKDWKLGVSYLLFREEVKNIMYDAFGKVEKNFRKIAKNEKKPSQGSSLKKLKKAVDESPEMTLKVQEKTKEMIEKIEKDEIYAPIYGTENLLEKVRHTYQSEFLMPCQISLNNLETKEIKDSSRLCFESEKVEKRHENGTQLELEKKSKFLLEK